MITIQDMPGDKVKIEMAPNFESLIKQDISGTKLSCAQGYALALINRAQEISKQVGPIKYKIPIIGH